jgi:hypothetical protein
MEEMASKQGDEITSSKSMEEMASKQGDEIASQARVWRKWPPSREMR